MEGKKGRSLEGITNVGIGRLLRMRQVGMGKS
jgi:hypothetical protein